MEEKPMYRERVYQRIERARNFHDKFEIKICNNNFIIYPSVFNPSVFFGTEFLVNEVIKIVSECQEKSPKFLEIGTGAGYTSVLAVLNGASHATCTDINDNALKNVKENALKYNILDQITTKYSDVFSGLNSDDKFDIIYWNYPFGHVNKPREELDLLERAVLDPFYRSLYMYLENANKYLNPDRGRLFLGFSHTNGHLEVFENMAKKNNWKVQLINEIYSDTTPIMQIGVYELIKIQ